MPAFPAGQQPFPGIRIGISRGATYGLLGPAERFAPSMRALGAVLLAMAITVTLGLPVPAAASPSADIHDVGALVDRIVPEQPGGHTEEASAFERRRGLASPASHQIMLYAGLTAFLLAFLAIPIVALVRRLCGHRAEHPSDWWLAWLTSALTLTFAAGLAWLFIIDSNNAGDTIFLGSPTLTGTLLASSAAFVLTGGLVVYTVAAWLRRWWRPAGRVAYTLLTLGAVPFMTVAYVYHLVGGVFT